MNKHWWFYEKNLRTFAKFKQDKCITWKTNVVVIHHLAFGSAVPPATLNASLVGCLENPVLHRKKRNCSEYVYWTRGLYVFICCFSKTHIFNCNILQR